MHVDDFCAWPSMSGRALDADVSSQAYYWTYRVHAQTLAAGTERDWSGMELWDVGALMTTSVIKRAVGLWAPLVSRQACGTHGSHNSCRHDCIFSAASASYGNCYGDRSDQSSPLRKSLEEGRTY